MLKKLVCILSAGLMIAALMSCSQEKKEEGPITLHYWTHEDPARTELETKLIAQFEKDNPNIKVERTTQGAAKLIELVQTAKMNILMLQTVESLRLIPKPPVMPIRQRSMTAICRKFSMR